MYQPTPRAPQFFDENPRDPENQDLIDMWMSEADQGIASEETIAWLEEIGAKTPTFTDEPPTVTPDTATITPDTATITPTPTKKPKGYQLYQGKFPDGSIATTSLGDVVSQVWAYYEEDGVLPDEYSREAEQASQFPDKYNDYCMKKASSSETLSHIWQKYHKGDWSTNENSSNACLSCDKPLAGYLEHTRNREARLFTRAVANEDPCKLYKEQYLDSDWTYRHGLFKSKSGICRKLMPVPDDQKDETPGLSMGNPGDMDVCEVEGCTSAWFQIGDENTDFSSCDDWIVSGGEWTKNPETPTKTYEVTPTPETKTPKTETPQNTPTPTPATPTKKCFTLRPCQFNQSESQCRADPGCCFQYYEDANFNIAGKPAGMLFIDSKFYQFSGIQDCNINFGDPKSSFSFTSLSVFSDYDNCKEVGAEQFNHCWCHEPSTC